MQELAATTVVLADDHAIVREGIAALCTANGMRVLGQVSDGSAAIEMIAALNPDFAILDLHMPIVTGVEAIRRLRSAGSTVKLLILSISREEGTVMEALRAGADAYLLKDGPSRHLLDAINFVRDGGVYVSPMLRGAKDIADLLEISPKTVDTYRASLMRKLNVHDLVGLVKFAIERNLTKTSPNR